MIVRPLLSLSRHAARLLTTTVTAKEVNESAAAPPPPLLSDERIIVPPDYNRWLQLIPACLSGLSVGTYAVVPGVLGPHMCRAQGVVAQASNDFAFSSIPPVALSAGLTCGAASILLAPYVHRIGTRRLALLGSVLFPAGQMALTAAAVAANSLPAMSVSVGLLGGLGFYCIYPQIPPLLTTRWFPDRKGLAVSIYFTAFGSGLLLGAPTMEMILKRFRVAPERLGGLDCLSSSSSEYKYVVATGACGERLVDLGDGVQRVVVLATSRDLATSGFAGQEEGVYLISDASSNGVVQALLVLAALNFGLLQVAAWSYRLPSLVQTAAHERTLKQQQQQQQEQDRLPVEDVGPPPASAAPLDGVSLAHAQCTPHMLLLALSTLGICASGLPFLSVGKLIVQVTTRRLLPCPHGPNAPTHTHSPLPLPIPLTHPQSSRAHAEPWLLLPPRRMSSQLPTCQAPASRQPLPASQL